MAQESSLCEVREMYFLTEYEFDCRIRLIVGPLRTSESSSEPTNGIFTALLPKASLVEAACVWHSDGQVPPQPQQLAAAGKCRTG